MNKTNMKKKNREQKLIEQYPDLFPENFVIQCNEGWLELIRLVCIYFQGLLDNTNDIKKINFFQIKEKFGYLRIYFDYSPKNKNLYNILHEFIWTIEQVSGLVCEDCGKIKNKNFDVQTKAVEGIRIRTLCKKCFQNAKDSE